MKTLETERLILRPFAAGDLGDFHEYSKNPIVGPSAGWKPHESVEESAGILTSFMARDDVWAIEYKENHKMIGSAGLHTDRKREGINARMVGYVLSEDYWGRGLMTEAVRRIVRYAFDEMSVDILSVYHYPHNRRSRRVIEKCGFQYEGTLRSASKIHDGAVMDDFCYSMLRAEYLALMRNPWTGIGLDDYEAHMKSAGVLQLQTLNVIMAEQLAGARGRVAVLGAAGGNGLEHVDRRVTDKVYAIDINGKYLSACRERFASLGDALETVCRDLSCGSPALPACDLMICNLIAEYIGARRLAEIARETSGLGAVSCVIQKDNGAAFVSASPEACKLKSLDSLHKAVSEEELTEEMEKAGFGAAFRKVYPLPNAKEFIRIDFMKNGPT